MKVQLKDNETWDAFPMEDGTFVVIENGIAKKYLKADYEDKYVPLQPKG